MPKSNLAKNPFQAQNDLIVEMIAGKLYTSGIEGIELARRAGMCKSTYYKKMKDPGSFTLDQLRDIYKALKVPIEDDARTKVI